LKPRAPYQLPTPDRLPAQGALPPLDDSRLRIEWERVADGVGALRERATSSPLSLFYTSLKRKLEPVLARPDGAI
jgi:hypothetical protein